MTVHFFTKGDISTSSSRQRAFYVAEELNKQNIYTVLNGPVSFRANEIIYCQRTVFNLPLSILLLLDRIIFRKKMIFDFDDAIHLRAPVLTKIYSKIASTVVVGSHALYTWAKIYNKNVFLIPTCVDLDKYLISQKTLKSNRVVLGWNGSPPGQLNNLRLLVPVFETLISKGFNFEFVLIGSLGMEKVYQIFRSIRGLNVKFIDQIDWNNPKVISQHLSRFDIGLNPLVDDEFNRGKCAFKAIEYMACGVPTICSDVGENRYLIKDAVNGYLVKDTRKWVEKIMLLANSAKLRRNIGLAGRQTILNRYSYKANTPKLLKILNNI